jgi:high affinity Mn2+ porin
MPAAYDYAKPMRWGYSYGIAAEWTQSWWTLRRDVFDLVALFPQHDLRWRQGFAQFEAWVR